LESDETTEAKLETTEPTDVDEVVMPADVRTATADDCPDKNAADEVGCAKNDAASGVPSRDDVVSERETAVGEVA